MTPLRKGCLVVTVLTAAFVMAANWTYPNTIANHCALSAMIVLAAGVLLIGLIFMFEDGREDQ